jgi:hypothetical protein
VLLQYSISENRDFYQVEFTQKLQETILEHLNNKDFQCPPREFAQLLFYTTKISYFPTTHPVWRRLVDLSGTYHDTIGINDIGLILWSLSSITHA